MENHYVCSACNGVSDTEGVCMTEGCSSNGQPLSACDCGDKSAHGASESAPAEETPAEAPTEGGETPAEAPSEE